MNFRAGSDRDGAGQGELGDGAARRHRARESSVLSIKPFRRLWIALSLSSLGDWLSIFALLALASYLTQKHSAGQSVTAAAAAQTTAVGRVWGAAQLPPLLSGIGAYVSIRFLTKYFSEDKSLNPFGIYCLIAGLGSLAYLVLK